MRVPNEARPSVLSEKVMSSMIHSTVSRQISLLEVTVLVYDLPVDVFSITMVPLVPELAVRFTLISCSDQVC